MIVAPFFASTRARTSSSRSPRRRRRASRTVAGTPSRRGPSLALRPTPRIEIIQMIRKRLLTRQDLPHVRCVASDLAIFIPLPTARDRDLRVASTEAVPLQLLDFLLEFGVVALVDGERGRCDGAGGGIVVARGALVAVDVEVDGRDGLAGDGGRGGVGDVCPAGGVGRLGGGDFNDAKVVHPGWRNGVEGRLCC